MSLFKVRQRYSPSQLEVESQQQQQHHHHHQSHHNTETIVPTITSTSSTLDFFCFYRAISSSSCQYDASSWRQRLESCLWIASAIFIVYYGDFRTNLVVLLARDARIHRVSFNLGLACLILDIGIFLYIALWINRVATVENKVVSIGPGAIPAATMIGLVAFVLFSHALWPIWRFLTLPMLFTLFMAVVVLAPYLAPYLNMKVDVDLKGLYVRPTE